MGSKTERRLSSGSFSVGTRAASAAVGALLLTAALLPACSGSVDGGSSDANPDQDSDAATPGSDGGVDAAVVNSRCAVKVADLPGGFLGWSADDEYFWGLDRTDDGDELWRFPLDGSTPFELTTEVPAAGFFSVGGAYVPILRSGQTGVDVYDKATGTLEPFAFDQMVYGMRADRDDIYFDGIDLPGDLQHFDVATGNVTIAVADDPDRSINAYDLTEDHIYIGTNHYPGGSIVRVAKVGAAEVVVASLPGHVPSDVEVVDGYVYYTGENGQFENPATDSYFRVPIEGGTPELLYSLPEETAQTTRLGYAEVPSSFQVLGDYIYLVTQDRYVRIPVTGGEPVPVFTSDSYQDLYVHPTGLYTLFEGALLRAPLDAELPLLPLDAEECLIP